MKEVILFILLFGLFCGSVVYTSWTFGRKFERKFWMAFYAESIEKTCLECSGFRR